MFAVLQSRGIGMPKDSAAAQAALTELCTRDAIDACAELALIILPSGTPADRSRARELLTRACNGKHAQACEFLKSLPQLPD
jgi:TPR repeat protein